ncbi:MAG: hypothetical protein MK081_05235 [Flavobacteriales bacterium]|nr:hypothetical protein [Flavobacteriales bacterium]
MKSNQLQYILLLLLVFTSLGYSAYQHFLMPMDGDLPSGVLVDADVQQILDNPLGLEAIDKPGSYPNPNRFFSHYALHIYMGEIPAKLGSIVKPENAPYLAMAIIKILTELGLLLFILRITKIPWKTSQGLLIILATHLFFAAEDHMLGNAIIDKAPTYFFFYALPFFWTFLSLFPLIELIRNPKENPPSWTLLLGFIFIPVSCLSGPTNTGVVAVVFIMLAVSVLRQPDWRARVLKLPVLIYIMLFSLGVLYSLFIGSLDAIGMTENIPLSERYVLLAKGVWTEMLSRRGYYLLFILWGTGLAYLRFKDATSFKKLLRPSAFVLGFVVLYLLLLPLGGYRSWRPNMLRNDVLIPVTYALILVNVLGWKSILPLIVKDWMSAVYVVIVVRALFLFWKFDPLYTEHYLCQQARISELQSTDKDVAAICDECLLVHWWKAENPGESLNSVKLLKLWGIESSANAYVVKPCVTAD